MADKCMVGTSPKMLQTAGIEFPSTPTHEKISRFLAAPRRGFFFGLRNILRRILCAPRRFSLDKAPLLFLSPVGFSSRPVGNYFGTFSNRKQNS